MLAAGASIDLPIRYRKVGVLCEVLPRELQYGIHVVLYRTVCAGNRAVLVCPAVRSIGVYHHRWQLYPPPSNPGYTAQWQVSPDIVEYCT